MRLILIPTIYNIFLTSCRETREISLDCVKNVLMESTAILCENLNPKDILMRMKSMNALTHDEVTKVNHQVPYAEVNKLLEILMRKPASSYEAFMSILQEERPDLHKHVKAIEDKHYSGKEQNKLVNQKYFFQTFGLL